MSLESEAKRNGGYAPICGKCSAPLVQSSNVCPVTGDVEDDEDYDDEDGRIVEVALRCEECGFRWVIQLVNIGW